MVMPATNAGAGAEMLIEQRAYFTGLLTEIRASRAQTQRLRLQLSVRAVLAVLRRQTDAVRRLAVQLHANSEDLEHLRRAEAEVRERLPLQNGSILSPGR